MIRCDPSCRENRTNVDPSAERLPPRLQQVEVTSPVFATGTVLRLEGEVESLTPSKTKPNGTVTMKWTMYNQRDEAVYTVTPITIVPRRPNT